MTNVLILDDDVRRFPFLLKYAASVVGVCEPVFTKTADEAMVALQLRSRWDLLMLDHDLGGRVYVPSDEPNTGYRVAKFIVEHSVAFDRCILHSLNIGASRRMGQLLKECGRRVNITPVISMI